MVILLTEWPNINKQKTATLTCTLCMDDVRLTIWFMVCLCHPLRNSSNFIPSFCGPPGTWAWSFFRIKFHLSNDRWRSINLHAPQVKTYFFMKRNRNEYLVVSFEDFNLSTMNRIEYLCPSMLHVPGTYSTFFDTWRFPQIFLYKTRVWRENRIHT